MWTKLEITTKDNDGGDDLSESNGIAADDATTAAAREIRKLLGGSDHFKLNITEIMWRHKKDQHRRTKEYETRWLTDA